MLADSGCDLVELGIPFSDPLADGATIQRASHNALQNGVTPRLRLEVARELSAKVNLIWVEAEDIEHNGADAYLRRAQGVLVPGGFGERGSEGKIHW